MEHNGELDTIGPNDGESMFLELLAGAIAPHIFEGGYSRVDAARACARLAGSIIGGLVEDGEIQYQHYPSYLGDNNLLMTSEFDKFMSAGDVMQ